MWTLRYAGGLGGFIPAGRNFIFHERTRPTLMRDTLLRPAVAVRCPIGSINMSQNGDPPALRQRARHPSLKPTSPSTTTHTSRPEMGACIQHVYTDIRCTTRCVVGPAGGCLFLFTRDDEVHGGEGARLTALRAAHTALLQHHLCVCVRARVCVCV